MWCWRCCSHKPGLDLLRSFTLLCNRSRSRSRGPSPLCSRSARPPLCSSPPELLPLCGLHTKPHYSCPSSVHSCSRENIFLQGIATKASKPAGLGAAEVTHAERRQVLSARTDGPICWALPGRSYRHIDQPIGRFRTRLVQGGLIQSLPTLALPLLTVPDARCRSHALPVTDYGRPTFRVDPSQDIERRAETLERFVQATRLVILRNRAARVLQCARAHREGRHGEDGSQAVCQGSLQPRQGQVVSEQFPVVEVTPSMEIKSRRTEFASTLTLRPRPPPFLALEVRTLPIYNPAS